MDRKINLQAYRGSRVPSILVKSSIKIENFFNSNSVWTKRLKEERESFKGCNFNNSSVAPFRTVTIEIATMCYKTLTLCISMEITTIQLFFPYSASPVFHSGSTFHYTITRIILTTRKHSLRLGYSR